MEINWLGAVLAVVVGMAVAGVWYGKVFVTPWWKLTGMDGAAGRSRGVVDVLGNHAPPAQCLRAEASEADPHQQQLSTGAVSRHGAGDRAAVTSAPDLETRSTPTFRNTA